MKPGDLFVAFNGDAQVRRLAQLLNGEIVANCPGSVPDKMVDAGQ